MSAPVQPTAAVTSGSRKINPPLEPRDRFGNGPLSGTVQLLFIGIKAKTSVAMEVLSLSSSIKAPLYPP